jgi:hypothetical protein
MLKALLYKWFGLEELPCDTCEVLRAQLDESNRERRELLNRLLEPSRPEPVAEKEQELIPIQPSFVPWRVRQQMLEQEDRIKAKLMKDKAKEIAALEKELGVATDESAPSGGVKVDASRVG